MAEFNPIKQDKDGVLAKRQIWTSKAIEAAIKGLTEGRKLVANPFYEGNTKLLKGELVFKRTPQEIDEFKHCMTDILYFANTHCQLMTPKGIQHVQLRNYQEKYLRHLVDSQLSIYLACRQCGKCNSLIVNVLVKLDDLLLDNIDEKLKNYLISNYRVDSGVFQIPLFELYNLYDSRPIWRIKYQLYKRLYRATLNTNKASIQCLTKLISLLDNFEPDNRKLIHSFELKGVQMLTDTGWSEASHIHLTRQYYIYKLKLENGNSLECADQHILFDKHMEQVFVRDLRVGDYVQTRTGISKIISLERSDIKICMCDVTINDLNHRYYTNDILSHNTTTSAIFLLWYALFNTDKNALVLGNKRRTACEILDKIKKIYLEIPHYLKPGILKWNEGEIVFDNGCRIMAEATTINSGISFTFHCVLADEFAHVPVNILDKFYNNLFPTITAGKAKFIITSTQNGYNLFYRLYKGAEAGENDYKPFKTDWDEVPEWDPEQQKFVPRDEEWHRRQVANYGSEEAFNAQFGTSFDINANTLIDVKKIKEIRPRAKEFVNKDLPGISNANRFYWKPEYEPAEMLRRDYIVVTIDIAEGIGNDYTIFLFNRLTEDGTETIGMFRANKLNVEACTRSLQELSIKYLNADRLLISLETNLYGELFIKQLFDNRDNINELGNFDESVLVKYYNEARTHFTYGIKVSRGNKTINCKLFKEKFERGEIENVDSTFLLELENFCDNKGNDCYAASFGHDDIVMAQIQLVAAMQTLQYKYLREAFEENLNIETKDDRYYNAYDLSDQDEMLQMSMIDSFTAYQQYVNDNLKRLDRHR